MLWRRQDGVNPNQARRRHINNFLTHKHINLVDVSDIFYFFLSGGGGGTEEVSEQVAGGGGSVLLKTRGRGGVIRGGGGGYIYIYIYIYIYVALVGFWAHILLKNLICSPIL